MFLSYKYILKFNKSGLCPYERQIYLFTLYSTRHKFRVEAKYGRRQIVFTQAVLLTIIDFYSTIRKC